MAVRVPKHISQRYADGAHGFRMEKRNLLRILDKILRDFRTGSTHFPCGSEPVDIIQDQIEILKQGLSVRKWGK